MSPAVKAQLVPLPGALVLLLRTVPDGNLASRKELMASTRNLLQTPYRCVVCVLVCVCAVCMRVLVCVCVCMYVCMYVYVCSCVFMCVLIHVCKYVFAFCEQASEPADALPTNIVDKWLSACFLYFEVPPYYNPELPSLFLGCVMTEWLVSLYLL